MQSLDYGFNYDNGTKALERYQGQNLPHHYPRHMRQAQPRLSRQEQNIAYDFSAMKITESIPKMEYIAPAEMCSVPVNNSEKVAVNDLTKTHFQNIYHSLEHRLKVAQSQGDKFLINLLENESQTLDFLCLDCS
ncbi:hypothetical protein [Aphanothece sacrum]|uniref:Uncharacterized protein n=1 Tax=Aphanothece sacrum FPU1 TaxID=1920663 RepID=A0A401ILS1_APHSA|nr:hypothetical protein [Aphanothece sacrum]GBF82187.1 hypothetical protein AsFPU1_3615 [Aphanothece sacrum FPU1]GBF87275.1 hypothetical protein AsFPU3_4357 [Aphanothece sacrum FPU3]